MGYHVYVFYFFIKILIDKLEQTLRVSGIMCLDVTG